MVKRLARSAIRRTTGRTIEAPLSGQRAVRGELLRSLRLADRFGLETAMTLDALRAGARVSEVPVAMDHRHTGRTVAGFKHRALQGRDIVRALWPRLTGARARVAVIVLGLLVALVGSIWSGYRAIPHSVAFGGVAVHRERIYYRIALAFIVAQAIVYAGAIVLLAGRRRRGRDIPVAAPALRAASLLIAGFPLATFLYRTVPDSPRFGSSAFAVMLAIDAVLVAGVWRLRAHRLQALGWVLGLTAAVLVVDVSTGGRLQEPSIMGYSPHIAGRFYGIGKTAFAILAASVILPAAIHLERAPRRSEALVAVGALFVLAIVIDGAPMLGDDVGGMLTLVPALGLLMVAFSRRTGHSPLRAGVVAALVAGLVGSVVHGSGVIATAMVFVFVGPFLMTLAPLA